MVMILVQYLRLIIVISPKIYCSLSDLFKTIVPVAVNRFPCEFYTILLADDRLIIRDNDDKFYCSNGLCIEWSWVCDGRKDCLDGSDETKALCARYEYGKNITMGCGKVRIKNQIISEKDNQEAMAGTAPWNVGIYKLNEENSENYDLKCGGSIIAPNLVISAAHCFWQKGMLSKSILNDNLYKIAVGKYDRNFTIIDNDFTQIMNVEHIYMKEGYIGSNGFHVDDIAVIVLASTISMSNYVAPVCIDWNRKYHVQNGAQGKIVGWGKTEKGTLSPVLLETSLPYIDQETCRKKYTNGFEQFVTVDKFCAGSQLVSGKGVGVAFSGAGLTFMHYNSYYLTGIACLAIKDSTTNDSITVFTDIEHHVQWIRGLLNKHITGKLCILPKAEGVVYSYEGSNEKISHGTLINHHLNIIENCAVGYHKAYSNGFRFCRENGKWLSNSEKLCFKMCPSLESDSLDIKCTLNGKYANCSNLSIPDTIAKLSCKPSYSAPNGQEETPLDLLCQSNGTWNKQLYSCNPYCGKVYAKNQVLIENGEKARIGTAPWNVGIYRLNKENSNYDLICGGSIIAPNLVVSAAHCFWEKSMLSKRISINDGLYKIAVGKYDRNITVVDNDFTQIINVEMIYLNDGYYGPTGFHAEDIAIIVLPNRVSFSNGVAPVCIDWNSKYNEVNGNQGKIVGWGKTEKGISSPILLEASLPYIDHSSCRSMYTNGFEPFVTIDKFCAGSTSVSGQGVGKGDSGAGLCFLHSNSYYLTGIVSIKDSDSNNSIAVFTEVKHHIPWIRGLYNKHI